MANVQKIMSASVLTLKKEASIAEAARLLGKEGSGCVVITEGRKPIGIVTELDILRSMGSGNTNLKAPVSKIMTSPVTAMAPNTRLDQALKIVDTKGHDRYPVVDNDEITGLVAKKDIINSISDNLKFHRGIQNGVLILFVLFEFIIFILQ